MSSERRPTDADTNVINYKEEKLGLLQPLNVNQKFFKSTIIQKKKKKEKIERRKNFKKSRNGKDRRLKKSLFTARREKLSKEKSK